MNPPALTNDALLKELTHCHSINKLTTELVNMIKTLTYRVSKRYSPHIKHLTYLGDAEDYVLETLCTAWTTCDPKVRNPYAWFTQRIRQAFYQYIKNNKD